MSGAMQPGGAVGLHVTVNNRLARALRAAHDQAMLASGMQAWESLEVLPLEAFIADLWNAARERCRSSLPRLLSAAQSRALWHEVVADAAADLLATGSAAVQAAAARELLLRHEVNPGREVLQGSADVEAFAGWHEDYRERLRRGDWIDLPAAASRLVGLLRAGDAKAPAVLRLVGFDRVAPQLASLLEALRECGAQVVEEAAPVPSAPARSVTFADPEAEIRAAAGWCRALLSDGEAGPVGVVIPDLAARVHAVRACFEDVLHPCDTVRPSPHPGARAFNVSLGQRLDQLPVVSDALAMLEVMLGSAGAEAAGNVLLSPYFAGAGEEASARLGLEARLRDEGVRSIRRAHLSRLAARAGAREFARRLDDCAERLPRPRARQDMASHARRFVDLLARCGWPDGRSLDSTEFQAAEALRDELEQLGALAAVVAPCTAATAHSLLRRAVSERTFQPRAAPAPVQVLGVLEAAGLRFSNLWLMGFHDRVWPPMERPSALLPLSLQRQHGMPGATPESVLVRGRRLGERLLAAAAQPVISHALRDGDEELTPSVLLESARATSAQALPGAGAELPDEHIAARAPLLDRLPDWRARSVPHGWRARGGSRVLTDQAACPFRAFARHRLSATDIERAPAPLDARSRGILAHRLMQILFGSIAGSVTLESLDATAREALAMEAATAAVASVVRAHPGEVSRRLADAERERLARMALRWMALESSRASFEVEALEQKRVVRVGGLVLDIQLDRVDRVDGRRLLMDYKTGRAQRADWFGERPGDPQLPLYALALDADGAASAPVAGVVFARLRRGEEGFEGVAEDAAWAPGLNTLGQGRGGEREFASMAALKAHWAEVLGALGEAFADGDARVDPRPGACRYCEVRPLCRVDALRAVQEGVT